MCDILDGYRDAEAMTIQAHLQITNAYSKREHFRELVCENFHFQEFSAFSPFHENGPPGGENSVSWFAPGWGGRTQGGSRMRGAQQWVVPKRCSGLETEGMGGG